MNDMDKNVTDSNVLNLNKDHEAHLWIASYFLKKDMNEDEGYEWWMLSKDRPWKTEEKEEKLQENVCGQLNDVGFRGF